MNGWVIERYMNSELRYWGGKNTSHFSPKHEEAIRFAREEDAQAVLAWILDGQGRAAQHVWRDTAA